MSGDRSTPGQGESFLNPGEPVGFTISELRAVARHVRLTSREADLYILRLADRNAKEIGALLGLAPGYVNVRLAGVSKKLEARGGLPGLRRRSREIRDVLADGGESDQ